MVAAEVRNPARRAGEADPNTADRGLDVQCHPASRGPHGDLGLDLGGIDPPVRTEKRLGGKVDYPGAGRTFLRV